MRRLARRAVAIAAGLAIAAALAVWLGFVPDAKEPPYRLVASWGGPGSAPEQFSDPNGIALRGDRVYVADSRNHRIQIFDRQGHYQGAIEAGPEGLLPQARPMNLNIAGDRLYVADYWNDVVQVYSLAQAAPQRLATLGGPGAQPGRLRAPGGAGAEPDGTVVVADFYNQRVQMLSPQGRFLRQIGVTGQKAYAAAGRFNYPMDVAVHPDDGRIYVADGYNDRIQVFDDQGRFLFMWGGPFGLHLPAAINVLGRLPGWLRVPTSLAIAPDGAVFVADQENNRVQKFTAGGKFLTAFGTPPGGPAYTVGAVAVAADGTVYVTNLAQNRVERWRPAAVRP